jgi:IS30 family transposase
MGKYYSQLSLVERTLLQAQLVLRWSPAAIAAGLQRARSTIIREMARNGWHPATASRRPGRPRLLDGYQAQRAHERSAKLAAKPRVERTTLYVALVKLENGRAETAAVGFADVLNRFNAAMRLSMTYDQAREMARHEDLTASTGVKVYFAHPHSPWERGRNENTNGLLRQYLPKGEDLSGYSQQQLDDIAEAMNARPRKSLGWKAPAELFLPERTFNFQKYWSTENTINRVALVT